MNVSSDKINTQKSSQIDFEELEQTPCKTLFVNLP